MENKMGNRSVISIVKEIMLEFADQTGLTSSDKPPSRYLWTDAFAVCNFLDLYRQTKDEKFKRLTLRLVDQVHHILGRHREDDSRTGWISGLSEEEGEKHPTKGGLRIGKKMDERKPADPFDQRLEWERDGQYYHYLTKWMHALNQTSRVTGDKTFNCWALELAEAAHTGFIYLSPYEGEKRMYGKMSIDLSYPLVPSMGHHDPLDGYITYHQLKTTNVALQSTGPNLTKEISDMAAICKGKNWGTDDSLGLGGLLSDAFKVGQLIISVNFEEVNLLNQLLKDSLTGLENYAGQNQLTLPPDYRLAFRELGLSIGLHAVERFQRLIKAHKNRFSGNHSIHSRIESLIAHTKLIDIIESFWLNPKNTAADTWKEHLDINRVMLATSLAPDGYLML
jgi:hypothetical protein